jgi:hypothetical protein
MRSRVAANKILLDGSFFIANHFVERNIKGIVTGIYSLAAFNSEPSSTLFYNGVITADISVKPRVGLHIADVVLEPLSVGYSGKLLLWQGISLDDMIITETTTYSVI